MAADIKGTLAQIDNYYKFFNHKGKPLTKEQVRAVLEYGISKGYETTDQLTDDEVDIILGKRIRYSERYGLWLSISSIYIVVCDRCDKVIPKDTARYFSHRGFDKGCNQIGEYICIDCEQFLTNVINDND